MVTNNGFSSPYWELAAPEFKDPQSDESASNLQSLPTLEDDFSSDQILFLDDELISTPFLYPHELSDPELPVSSQKRLRDLSEEEESDLLEPKRFCSIDADLAESSSYISPVDEIFSNFIDNSLTHHSLPSHSLPDPELQISSQKLSHLLRIKLICPAPLEVRSDNEDDDLAEDEATSSSSSLQKTTLLANDHFSEATSSEDLDKINDEDDYEATPKDKPWTEKECELLKTLVVKNGSRKYGINWILIGQELGRKPHLCKCKWRRMKSTQPSNMPNINDIKSQIKLSWTDNEIELMKQLRNNPNMTWEKIGKRLKRPAAACKVKWWNLKNEAGSNIFKTRCARWTDEETLELAKLIEEGKDLDTIAKKLGKTFGSCREKWRRMNLIND